MKKVVVEERYFVRFDAEKTITLLWHSEGVPVERSPSRDNFERSQRRNSTRYVDRRADQPASRSIAVGLDVEDTHAPIT